MQKENIFVEGILMSKVLLFEVVMLKYKDSSKFYIKKRMFIQIFKSYLTIIVLINIGLSL